MTDSYEAAVDKLVQYIDQTVTFAQGQLPEVAQQILAYGQASTTISMWAFIVLAGISFLVFLVFSGAAKSDSEMGGPAAFMFLVFLILSGFAISQRLELLKMEKAPKLYVIEEVRSLINKQH